MSSLKEKLSKITSDKPSNWMAKAKYSIDNHVWLMKSAEVALLVLGTLKEQQLSQKDLAERMKISPQQISKIVKGQENLTLETISNLEAALGIKIIDINLHPGKASKGKNKPGA